MTSVRTVAAIWMAAAAVLVGAEAPPVPDGAEVRIPYGELRRLLAAAERDRDAGTGLVAARLGLTAEGGAPVVAGSFRVLRAEGAAEPVVLVGGAVAVDSQEPADAPLVMRGGMLCHAGGGAGVAEVAVRLVAAGGAGEEIKLVLPPCPALAVDAGGLPEGAAAVVECGGVRRVLGRGGRLALPAAGGELVIRLLDGEAAREALLPPAPSEWSWQQRVLVLPADDELVYQVEARGSAAGGAGVEAELALPAGVRAVEAAGDDVADVQQTRDGDGAIRLRVRWATRGVLDRALAIHYRAPLRSLDERWELAAPAGPGAGGTRAQFLVGASPRLAYAADGLAGPLAAEAAPAALARALGGAAFYQLDGGGRVELGVRRLPVMATAEAVVAEAEWSQRVEPDGALLLEGTLAVEHAGPQRVVLDTPDGMALLTAAVAGRPVEPVDLGGGRFEFALPAAADGGKPTVLACSFTGRVEPLAPVEGTLALALPRTPLFVRALMWRVELPAVYQSEVHGNVVREAGRSGDGPSVLRLRKNLCRDERPEVRVFYTGAHPGA